jgi:hypothetical protein
MDGRFLEKSAGSTLVFLTLIQKIWSTKYHPLQFPFHYKKIQSFE